MKKCSILVLLAIALVACGGEPAAATASTEPAAAPAAAPTGETAAGATVPTAAPAAPPEAPAVAPTATAEAPTAVAAADLADPAAVCAAYYDGEVRDALARAEESVVSHPDLPIRTSLGVGERSAFIAGCSTLPPERLQCFTAYAATHVSECLAFILSPPPSLASIAPLNNLTIEELRALAATLPPAP